MNMTVTCFLEIGAFVATIVAAIGKCPLWVPVLLLSIAGLLLCFPK
jgi:hypothetical protein